MGALYETSDNGPSDAHFCRFDCMISYPCSKINLGLSVERKREDGFHDIESILYPIALCDILEIIPNSENESDEFSATGISIPGDLSSNLCLKALHLLRADFDVPSVKMHLHKQVPTGAGLGGGSADGTHALLQVNELFALGLSVEDLTQYAALLGSDCPFFVEEGPKLATGRGEQLVKMDEKLRGYTLVLAKPDLHISTAEAYAGTVPEVKAKTIGEIYQQPMANWKSALQNDFESVVFEKFPELERIKNTFYNAGAVYASLTGTGSAVYGIFQEEQDLSHFFQDLFYWSGKLL